MTLKGIPKKVIIPFKDYKISNPNFWIDNSQKETLLSTMQEILATIGEESHPTFLNSLIINVLSGRDQEQVILYFSHYNLP
jgi:hypothetical protein